MKITNKQLVQIIKEELAAVMQEVKVPDYAGASESYFLSLVKKMGYNQAKEWMKKHQAKNQEAYIQNYQRLEDHFNMLAQKQMKEREKEMRQSGATEEEILERVPRAKDASGNTAGGYDLDLWRSSRRKYGWDPWEIYKDPYERYGVDREAYWKWKEGK